MKIRKTPEYKEMTPLRACGLVSGIFEVPNDAELAAAWQYIYDHQLYREMEGYYGRVLFNDLIPAGMIEV